ncbi:MAG: hypothetical protein K0R39_5222, partial [Symbiobacteriaceae bacterium]|nr:hypothetical protein [Symbiobacteriaceae bacterium]
PDQIIERINRVTTDQVGALANRLFLKEPKVLSLVGQVRPETDLTQFGFTEVDHA